MIAIRSVFSMLLLAGGEMPAKPTREVWNHFAIEIPATYVAKNVTPRMADFQLYEVVSGDGRSRCTLYFGNHPAFPKLKWSNPPIEERHKGVVVKEYGYTPEERRIEGLLRFSGLAYGGTDESPFSMVHYVSENLEPAQAQSFMRMVGSIVVVKRRLD